MKTVIPAILLGTCLFCGGAEQNSSLSPESSASDVVTLMQESIDETVAGTERLEGLILRAFYQKLRQLPPEQRNKLVAEQLQWQEEMDRRNKRPVPSRGQLATLSRIGIEERRLANRLALLRSPEKVYQAFLDMKDLPIRYKGKDVCLCYGELDVQIRNEFMPDDDFKINTVAQLVPGFCRRWVYGNAVYHAGIIVPTNDHVYSSSNMGYNQNLVIWRNRKPFAVYEIDRKFDISDIIVEERNVTVQGKNGEKQKFDFQQENTNPVKIDGGY